MFCFNSVLSDVVPVNLRVSLGCMLAPMLFGIFFYMLLKNSFRDYTNMFTILINVHLDDYVICRARTLSDIILSYHSFRIKRNYLYHSNIEADKIYD